MSRPPRDPIGRWLALPHRRTEVAEPDRFGDSLVTGVFGRTLPGGHELAAGAVTEAARRQGWDRRLLDPVQVDEREDEVRVAVRHYAPLLWGDPPHVPVLAVTVSPRRVDGLVVARVDLVRAHVTSSRVAA